jgi:hypothetical protein
MRSSCEHRPLVCIGHSHVRCIADAAQRHRVPIVIMDFWRITPAVVREQDTLRFCEAIERHLGDGPIFSLIGGTAHDKLGLVVHPRRFDFVLPSAPDLPFDEQAELVPFDGVRAALAVLAQPYLDLLRLLRSSHRGPLFHLQPPPVLADEARIRPTVPWMFFEGRREVSPRHLRYKLWRAHSELLAAFCDEQDITFLNHPPRAVDDDGFLRRQHHLNAMHVNAEYGALLLEQMRAVA